MSYKILRIISVAFLIFSIFWVFLTDITHSYIFSFDFLIPFFTSLEISIILYLLYSYFDQKNKSKMTKSLVVWLIPKIIFIDIPILILFFLFYLFALGLAGV